MNAVWPHNWMRGVSAQPNKKGQEASRLQVTQQLRKLGGEPEPMSVDAFTRWYRREVQLWKDVVAKAKIPTED